MEETQHIYSLDNVPQYLIDADTPLEDPNVRNNTQKLEKSKDPVRVVFLYPELKNKELLFLTPRHRETPFDFDFIGDGDEETMETMRLIMEDGNFSKLQERLTYPDCPLMILLPAIFRHLIQNPKISFADWKFIRHLWLGYNWIIRPGQRKSIARDTKDFEELWTFMLTVYDGYLHFASSCSPLYTHFMKKFPKNAVSLFHFFDPALNEDIFEHLTTMQIVYLNETDQRSILNGQAMGKRTESIYLPRLLYQTHKPVKDIYFIPLARGKIGRGFVVTDDGDNGDDSDDDARDPGTVKKVKKEEAVSQ
jgi:hypothetical protein